jgi:hypothetical protein
MSNVAATTAASAAGVVAQVVWCGSNGSSSDVGNVLCSSSGAEAGPKLQGHPLMQQQ